MTMRKRKPLPATIEAAILAGCKRRCCLCIALENDDTPKMDGQIAHIDHNRNNNNPENLVYLCLRHHDSYDSVTSQSKGITSGEIKSYKEHLSRHLCAAQSPNLHSSGQKEQIPQTEASIYHLGVLESGPPLVLSPDLVLILPEAETDCQLLGIQKDQVIHFIFIESVRHPKLFDCSFSSVPLIFGSHVLLLSWDWSRARVERILARERAYPLNDAWSECLSLYRQATILPYRTHGQDKLLLSGEIKRTTQHYARLVDRFCHFLALLEGVQGNPTTHSADLRSLLEEADFALSGNDTGTGVARLEAVLSTVHKLLLRYAPQRAGLPTAYREVPPVKIPQPGKPSVLILDDNLNFCGLLTELFQDAGFSTITANDASTALRTLVEHDFDLVVADIMLRDEVANIDGREVAIAAKRINPKTKVIVLTGYAGMLSGIIDKHELLPFDEFVTKPPRVDDLITRARSLLKYG